MSLTGLPPQREQQWQERTSLRLAREYELSLAREIRRAMRAIARSHGNPGKQAEAKAEHGKRVERLVIRNWQQSWEVFGKRLLDATRKAMSGMERKDEQEPDEVFNRYLRNFIREYGALKVTQITGTTEKQAMRIINEAVAEGVAEGLGQAALGSLIRDRMNVASDALSVRRGRLIARTETHNAQSAASHAAAKASGLPMKKQWVASRGERTREWHSDVDGQTRVMDGLFLVDGEEMLHPGDPDASAHNVINCRCAVVYIPG